MSNTLSVVPAVEKAVVPKPTKTEVIEALVALRMKQQREEIEVAQVQKKALQDKAESLLAKHFRKVAKTADLKIETGYVLKRTGSLHNVSVEIKFDVLPVDLDKALKDYHTATTPAWMAESEIRKVIKEEIASKASKTERVIAMIESPESRKALEAMLVSFGLGSSKTIEA